MWKIIDYFKSLFCSHEWRLIYEYDIDISPHPKYKMISGHIWIYQCPKCLRIKKVKV